MCIVSICCFAIWQIVGSSALTFERREEKKKNDAHDLFRQIVIQLPAYKLHKLEKGPASTIETTPEEMLFLYRQMQLIRRVEVACDQLYKQRLIRGFLHL